MTEPRRLVRSHAATLRPGGVVVFHEYADYGSWRVLPAAPAIDVFVAETMASWRAERGEPDIARTLPSLLADEGFRIASARPLVFALRPSDEMWLWPAGFIRAGARRLRQVDRVSDSWMTGVLREIGDAERSDQSLMITPLVLEVIAIRR